MTRLTAKQESFIVTMQKSEEHARKGFEILATRSDADIFFEAVLEAGLFDPKYNYGPVPADDPGYVRIPYWSALDYLVSVSKSATEKNDVETIDKILAIVRNATLVQGDDGNSVDNYHTWRKFAEIIGLLPSFALDTKVIELIPLWLGSSYDRGMVGVALSKGAMKNLLESESAEDWIKASRILDYCTTVTWKADKTSSGRKKPVTAVEDYWLKKIIERHAKTFGIKIGKSAAEIFRSRITDVFGEKFGTLPTYVTRAAVEKHEQNHDWHGTENIFVEGMRDVLLSWVDSDPTGESSNYIAELLRDSNEMVRRIAIYVLDQHWQLLSGLYESIVGPELFSSRNIHEAYNLLKNNFAEFSDSYKDTTLEAIRKLPLPKDDENPEGHLKYLQRNWLSAIAGNGHKATDEWFDLLNSDLTIGRLSSHPDFHYYSESFDGTGPSPYTAQELLAYSENGDLINTLNDFIPSNDWRGPSIHSLVQALEEAVKLKPKEFLHRLEDFHRANRPYQYGVISGFKRLWNESEGKELPDYWGVAWPKLFDFFDKLLTPEFWSEPVVEGKDLTPTRNWIPSAIAEFLQAGAKKDEHSFSADLLPRSFLVIENLLNNVEPVTEASDDPMSQAINSEKGKAIEALFNHALRSCRVSDQLHGNHLEIWESLLPVFDREIDKCKGKNYEFSTLAAAYLPNLEYISPEWVRDNFDKIFPAAYPVNFLCAIDGLTYCSATQSNYALLVAHGVLDRAFSTDLKGRQARERLIQRICLAYLWGDEQLDSPRIELLFHPERIDDLKDAVEFFWSVRRQELTPEQVEMVINFWSKITVWVTQLLEPPKQLMSSLSRLICYVDKISEIEKQLLLTVAPHVSIGYNADHFIEELDRLIESFPSDVSMIVGKVLESHKPTYDYEDRLKNLLHKLSDKGHKEDALRYADKLRHLSGFIEFFK
jgi:hypothetical protein